MLFHNDNNKFFNTDELRIYATKVIRSSSLIKKAYDGNIDAVIGLHVGFWPFVREFEKAIDKQNLPREPLVIKFGERMTRLCFLSMHSALREMRLEENAHSIHWKNDAAEAGIGFPVFDDPVYVHPKVQQLIDMAYSTDLPKFFATLAGTEYIAEELSQYLLESDKFLNLFRTKRWIWGEVHTEGHAGPSHLDIDLDLARAYEGVSSYKSLHPPIAYNAYIQSQIVNTIFTFQNAATEIEGVYFPRSNNNNS